MFPVTENFVESQYIKNSVKIRISNSLQKEIIYKANKVLNLYKHGMKKIVFPDIATIEKILLEELKNNKNLIKNPCKTKKDDIK